MANKTGFVIVKNNLNSRTKKYLKATNPGGSVDIRAKEKVGLQLLNNIINGSPGSSVVPPIMTGRLRASGSVFVGSYFVGDSSDRPVIGNDNPSPARNHQADINTITVGFNTPYAARWHENRFVPGGRNPSQISRNNPNVTGDVGYKYIEQHIKADGPELMHLYATLVKKETDRL